MCRYKEFAAQVREQHKWIDTPNRLLCFPYMNNNYLQPKSLYSYYTIVLVVKRSTQGQLTGTCSGTL